MNPVSQKLIRVLALFLLALCLSPGVGSAQNAYQGKFTLPFAARWQGAVLPAGNYTLSMYSAAAPYTLELRGVRQHVMIMGVSGDPKPISEASQLTLLRSGSSYVVRSFQAGPIGLDIGYSVGSGKAKNMATVTVPIEYASTGK